MMSTQVNFHVQMFAPDLKLPEELENKLREALRQSVLNTFFDYDPTIVCELTVRGPEIVSLF